jgi:hypothetical protein
MGEALSVFRSKVERFFWAECLFAQIPFAARLHKSTQLAPLSLHDVLHVTLLPFMQALQTSTH